MKVDTPSDEMEDNLDHLRILLSREGKYKREDYLGCLFDDGARGISDVNEQRGQRGKEAGRKDIQVHVSSAKVDTKDPPHGAPSRDKNSKLIFREHHRARLCDWAVEVVNYYRFPLHSVEVAMNLLDRFLAKYVAPEQRTMDCLHLLTLTSLYLALKLTTLERPAPEVFVRLSRSKFSVGQVERMEVKMMQGLGWLLHPPTAEEFADKYFTILADAYPAEIFRRVKDYTLESIRSTLSDYIWVRFAPSVVAMGALSWSLHRVGVDTADCYPSPLAELHRYGIYVHPFDSVRTLEYFYLRSIYSALKDGEQGVQSSSLSRKRSAPDNGPRNSSPVSIIKENPAVIED